MGCENIAMRDILVDIVGFHSFRHANMAGVGEGLGHCLSKKTYSKWELFGRETGSGLQ